MTDGDESLQGKAERRIEARRRERGLPDRKSHKVRDRLVNGAILVVIGVVLLLAGNEVALALGIIALVAAAYELITAAIANGVAEGKSD